MDPMGMEILSKVHNVAPALSDKKYSPLTIRFHRVCNVHVPPKHHKKKQVDSHDLKKRL